MRAQFEDHRSTEGRRLSRLGAQGAMILLGLLLTAAGCASGARPPTAKRTAPPPTAAPFERSSLLFVHLAGGEPDARAVRAGRFDPGLISVRSCGPADPPEQPLRDPTCQGASSGNRVAAP